MCEGGVAVAGVVVVAVVGVAEVLLRVGKLAGAMVVVFVVTLMLCWGRVFVGVVVVVVVMVVVVVLLS